ncbi:MAG: hypothetical protein KDC81_08985 [Flavobacteriaceae bacterium]|nr:hypothetical protein [Flavobacteriaceae bacterium]
MIKQILHKIFSVSLALIVLCSTVSFTIEKHFCGDTLIDVSVFAEADKCKMEVSEMELDKITKESCCKDKIDVVKGQDELIVKTIDDLDVIQQLFVATFTYSYLNLFEGLPQLVIPHKNYSPPILVTDIQVLDQVFLI